MHDIDLILTLTGGLAAALVCGYVTFRLGLSPIVGYLLAGFVVGPNTPGFVANQHLADQLAEVGVILLMFGVGLQFHLEGTAGRAAGRRARGARSEPRRDPARHPGRRGLRVGDGRRASSSAWRSRWRARSSCCASSRTTATCTPRPATSPSAGWSSRTSSPSWCWCCCPPSSATARRARAASLIAIGLAVVKVAAMVALTFLVGERLIPWLLDRVAATRSRELFTLTVLVVALGIAVGSAKLFGVSMALGAFLAGMVVGRSEFSLRAATEALPMRDAFAVLFFVSVGMLFDPRYLARIARAGRGDPGRHPARQAAGRPRHRPAARVSRFGSRSRSPSPWPRSASSRSSSPRPGRASASSMTRRPTRSSPRPSSRSR